MEGVGTTIPKLRAPFEYPTDWFYRVNLQGYFIVPKSPSRKHRQRVLASKLTEQEILRDAIE